MGESLNSPNDSIKFYTDILSSSRAKLGADAAMCVDIDIVLSKLKLGLNNEVKDQLDELQKQLNSLSSHETMVHSKFYHAASELRKVSFVHVMIITLFMTYICF